MEMICEVALKMVERVQKIKDQNLQTFYPVFFKQHKTKD